MIARSSSLEGTITAWRARIVCEDGMNAAKFSKVVKVVKVLNF
jgi:hypothetical protein